MTTTSIKPELRSRNPYYDDKLYYEVKIDGYYRLHRTNGLATNLSLRYPDGYYFYSFRGAEI